MSSSTAERLLEAGREELRAVGHQTLTIRTVALRAGVSSATAYTYLESKNRLCAELFWRFLEEDADVAPEGADAVARVRWVTRNLARRLAVRLSTTTGFSNSSGSSSTLNSAPGSGVGTGSAGFVRGMHGGKLRADGEPVPGVGIGPGISVCGGMAYADAWIMWAPRSASTSICSSGIGAGVSTLACPFSGVGTCAD